MKYKDFVIKELEQAKQISETIFLGMSNHTISVTEMFELNKKVLHHVKKALDRVSLEHDDAR